MRIQGGRGMADRLEKTDWKQKLKTDADSDDSRSEREGCVFSEPEYSQGGFKSDFFFYASGSGDTNKASARTPSIMNAQEQQVKSLQHVATEMCSADTAVVEATRFLHIAALAAVLTGTRAEIKWDFPSFFFIVLGEKF